MTPEISVLLPVRNGARWLSQAIDSILQQSFPNFELIVIDDGSTDETPALLRKYEALDDRVRVLTESQLGLVHALNTGLARARADLIARMDADDVAAPERLSRQLRCMKADSSTILLGTWARRIDAEGRLTGSLTPPPHDAKLRVALRRGNPFVHASVIFRTDPVRAVGGYRPAFYPAEDYDLWLRLSEGGRIMNLPEFLLSHRVHGEAVSAKHEVAQLFATRLSQRSADIRARTGQDPASSLLCPPSWAAADASSSFYAEDAALFRDLAAPAIANRRKQLTRGERSAAQRLLWDQAKRTRGLRQRLRFWRGIVLLSPKNAIRMLLQSRRWRSNAVS